MAKHTVVRLDDVDTNRVVSLQYHNGTNYAEIDNGHVLKLDSLMDGQREVYKAVAPTASTPLDQIVLVASPELMYDERKVNLDEFYNEAGVHARGYVLNRGCVVSITKDGIDGTPAVGHVIELQAGTKLKDVATATASTTTVGRVIALETVGTYEYVVIRVEA